MRKNQPNKFDHDKHARTKSENDFWGQIRRTVNGKPVDEEQIGMIVARIRDKLEIVKGDTLLDLACGNGALSARLFSEVNGYLGVDFSGRLIEIANKYFAIPHKCIFTHRGASEYVDEEIEPNRFTKVLCYGSFSYFQPEHAANVLRQLQCKFNNVSHVFIGNLPDKSLAENFYGENNVNPAELNDYESPIGIWRSRDEFVTFAKDNNWNAEISVMPSNYYAGHYRYDVLLTR